METYEPLLEAPAQDSVLQIRLIGDLQAKRSGMAATLPASKRTRALLGFLAAAQRPHSRQALCDLFWEGPDDPRGSLRWSLTKLRPVVNEAGLERLVADRERVEFRPLGADVDSVRVAALLSGDFAHTPTPALEAAAELLRDEFLDGLDLPVCYRFHNWCMAERERLGVLRNRVLNLLLHRLEDDPLRALPYARALIAADPLSEDAHARLTRLLVALGRPREAQTHAEQAGTLLRRELGAPLSGQLHKAASLARPSAVAPVVESPVAMAADEGVRQARRDPAPPVSLPGQDEARAAIGLAVAHLAAGNDQPLLLLLGEPGIGKTHRLDELSANAASTACRVLAARAFEAEMVRPYGIWTDLLGTLRDEDVPAAARHNLAVLFPSPEAASAQGDRAGLFAAVAGVLRGLAMSRPLVVILDDLQWLDDGSCSLLHYMVRTRGPPARILFAAAARPGELEDNSPAKRLVQSLQRERAVQEWTLAPLGLADVAALLRQAGSSLDPAEALRQSGGNPLYALELARADKRGDGGDSSSLAGLMTAELIRLPERERDVLAFAATVGRDFRPDLLSAAMDLPPLDLLGRIERLERRGLLRESGSGQIDFAHDLFRQATYRSLSQALRRILHRQVARAFAVAVASDDSLRSDLAHHASLAGDHLLAVGAHIAVGQRALQLFAPGEAWAASDRAMAGLGKVPPGPERIRLEIALLDVRIHAARCNQIFRAPELEAELRSVTDAAEAAGLHAEAANGFHLLSWLAQKSNAVTHTREATLLAAKASRGADDVTRCQQLANTARCLIDVEANVPGVRELIDDAGELASLLSLRVTELEWAQGLVARWDGDLPLAHRQIAGALELARLREDRWRQFELLIWLATVAFEQGQYDQVEVLSQEAAAVARKMGEDRAPSADALKALARTAQDPSSPIDPLADAIAALRTVDDKTHLAYALNEAALLQVHGGRRHAALPLAGEALVAAEAVGRSTEIVVSRTILASLKAEDGDLAGARDLLAAYLAPDGDLTALSARAIAHLRRVAPAMGFSVPTLVPTEGR